MENEVVESIPAMKKHVITLLQPGETVTAALKRLSGHGSAGLVKDSKCSVQVHIYV